MSCLCGSHLRDVKSFSILRHVGKLVKKVFYTGQILKMLRAPADCARVELSGVCWPNCAFIALFVKLSVIDFSGRNGQNETRSEALMYCAESCTRRAGSRTQAGFW